MQIAVTILRNQKLTCIQLPIMQLLFSDFAVEGSWDRAVIRILITLLKF